MSTPVNTAAPQFIVVPQSGMQFCRRLMIRHLTGPDLAAAWKAVAAIGYRAGAAAAPNPRLLRLIADHIACDRLDTTGWVAPDPRQSVFYRLIKIGSETAIDLVIDTREGAGNQAFNKIDCFVQAGTWPFQKRKDLASIYVAPNREPRGVAGSLVMDFGNTATTFIFFPAGASPLEARPLPLHNPFDPDDGNEQKRQADQRTLLRSTMLVLRAPESAHTAPWLILGKRAEELLGTEDPLITSLYAPKKYVRDWPAELKTLEPTIAYRGVQGQRTGMVPVLDFVRHTVEQMLTLTVSSQTNPRFASVQPELYPQVREILLTFPLTWREQEKALFAKMVEGAAAALFVLEDEVKQNFRVELICSEPAAVAAFALWQVFFQYFPLAPEGKNLRAPSLVSSLMGNTEGTQTLRLLVVDMGGGSTDIALTQADWEVAPDGVEIEFRVLESLRYNRAGDRISHLIATAIFVYLQEKHRVVESLAFNQQAGNPAFTLSYKRAAVSKIMELVEGVKAHLSGPLGAKEPWKLSEGDENALMQPLGQACARGGSPVGNSSKMRLEIGLDALRYWLEEDRQSMESRGEPGFMDIFFDLEELQRSLSKSGRQPHLVLLSGRTSRLPFFREMTAKHLALPLHRVRLLQELLPPSMHDADTPNIDKLAVLHGAHRFRFGSPIRFIPLPEEPTFKRYMGVVHQTPMGLRFGHGQVYVRPGEQHKETRTIRVPPSATLLLGHAFREDSHRAEVIATLSNNTPQAKDVEVTFETDHGVELAANRRSEGVLLTERISGGAENIVDNFNDTGRIDQEPDGLLRKIVKTNRDKWLLG